MKLRRSTKFWIDVALTVSALSFLAGCAHHVARNDFGSSGSDTGELGVVRRILREVPLIDGHNDVPWQYRTRVQNHLGELDLATDLSKLERPMHTDIARLRKGGLGAQFWSVYVPASMRGGEGVRAVAEQIDVVHRMVARYPETFELALTARDIVRIHRHGKIASLIGMEGGHSIGNSLAVLRRFYAGGARYMTLTHSRNVDWADSCTDEPEHGGLTEFGREVVREMNRLGMFVDLSHVAPDTMRDVLDVAAAPVIFSHSSALSIHDHPRNVPDDVLRRMADNGGVVMVTFVPGFISPRIGEHAAQRRTELARLRALHPDSSDRVGEEMAAWSESHPAPRATLSDVADHIDHIAATAGIDHVGIGSDFDGITTTPDGLGDVSQYPALFVELLRRGHSETDLKKIAGLNLLRAFRAMERVADRLQSERGPSEARIEDFDAAPPAAP